MSNKKALVKKLDKAVNGLISRLEKAEKFVLDQAPDICKEIVAEKKALAIYAIFNLGFFAFLSSMIALSGAVFINDGAGKFVIGLVFGVVAVVLSACSIEAGQDLISLKKAPKLTILRTLRNLSDNE